MRNFHSSSVLVISLFFFAPLFLHAQTNNAVVRPATHVAALPIGVVSSLAAIEINGRPTGQQSLIWNGDSVRAASGATAQLNVSGFGQIILHGNSAVRVVTNVEGHVLQAKVLQGELTMALNPDATAQVDLASATYLTTRGARVRASLREQRPHILATTGQVLPLGNVSMSAEIAAQTEQQTAPRKYLIKPLNLGTNTEIRARATRNVQVQVTDENDRPVPDAPIFFLLGNGGGAGSSGAGTLAGQTSVRAVTNAQGIADVNFTASDVVGSRSQIQIRVENSNAEWQGTIQIIRAAGFWTPQNTAIVIAAGTLAGVLPPILRKGSTSQVPNVEPRSGGSVILP